MTTTVSGEHQIHEDSIRMTFKSCKHGQLERVFVARSGEYVRVQRPSLWGVIPDQNEIIPATDFNLTTLLMGCWKELVKDTGGIQGVAYVVYCTFFAHWKAGLVTDECIEISTSKRWTRRGSDNKDYVASPKWFMLFPESAQYYHRAGYAVSNHDGEAPGNEARIAITNSSSLARKKLSNKLYDIGKSYIGMGTTNIYNPITKYSIDNWDIDKSTSELFNDNTAKQVAGNICLTAYWKMNKEYGFVFVDYIPEKRFGAKYDETGDLHYRVYEKIGFIREWQQDYCWNYALDYARNTIDGNNEDNNPHEQINKFINTVSSKEIKINIFPE